MAIHSLTVSRLVGTGTSNHLMTDYRETAAKFQKEWHVKEPHRDLPFARHVKGHALVSIINRGLVYQALEREYARSQVSDVPLTFSHPPCLGSEGRCFGQRGSR